MEGTIVTAKGTKYTGHRWNGTEEFEGFTEYENYLAHVYGIDVKVPEQVEQFREENKKFPYYLKEFEDEYQQWKNGRTE